MTSVVFLKVADNQTKLLRVTQLIQKLYDQGASILISTPTQEVAQYIDQLLWRLPEESFLPHTIAQQQTDEKVVITVGNINLNNASALLNLCPNAHENCNEFQIIYELYDQTHPSKEELSKQRQAAYKRKLLEVSIN